MKFPIFAATLFISTNLGVAAMAQGADAPPDLIKTCESCHGPGGNGETPSTPRLNGQLSTYIVNRLRELTDLTSNSPHASMAMYDIAHMKDSLRATMADYFAGQTPTAASPQSGKLAAMGARIFATGDPANHVEACQSCHGAKAEGQGNAPRLGGQHRSYLKTQLWDFNFSMRENSVMHPVALRLNPDQIDGLVAYLGAD
jgi:cytochrome c553